MRTKPFQAILNITRIADPLAAILGSFPPTVDEKVVFSDYDKRGREGNFIQRPYFTGSNNYEAGFFKILGVQRNPPISAQEWCLFNLAVFTCPAAKAAKYRARQQVNTWRYRYFADFPNMRLTENPPLGPSGAYHTAEIPVVFKTTVDSSGAPDTPQEAAISNYLNRAWAAFAKDPENAFYDEPYNFPQYDPRRMCAPLKVNLLIADMYLIGKTLIEFAVGNRTTPIYASPSSTDLACSVIEEASKGIPGGIGGLLASGGSLPPNLIVPGTPLLCSPV